MKAPNTIFIPIVEEEDKRLLRTIWWEHDRKSDDEFVKETIKYIRKDALLEWANAYKEECDADVRHRTDTSSYGQSVAMKDLINKIESL